MGWTDLLLRARALFSWRRAERDLDDELAFHLEMEARKLRANGADERHARQAARAHFGGLDLAREECRDARGLTFLENLARDIRYGARMLRKAPVFTTVAILSLAIGIGANTAVFTLVDTFLLRLLPVRNPEQLVVLKWGTKQEIDVTTAWSTNGSDLYGRQSTNVVSWRVYQALRGSSRTMSDVMAFAPLWQVAVAGNRQAHVTDAVVVSGNYFAGLGVTPAAGRLIVSDDDVEAGAPALVIGYRVWESWFGLAPDAIGKTLLVNGQPCTIVGVTPKSFLGLSTTRRTDLMLPIRARDLVAGTARQRVPFFADWFFWIQVVGRQRPGSTAAAIETEAAAALVSNLPESAWHGNREMPYVAAEPAAQGSTGWNDAYRRPLLIIMGVVAMTLLMACANLAGLLLARASARGRELTVRLALGAKRGRLIRQLLVEGALLSAGGALAGLAVAYWGLQGMLVLLNAGRSTPMEATLDGRVLAFTIAVSLATTLLFALAPAIRATRVDLAHGLKEETPTVAGSRFGAVRLLVAAQIAVALPLVTGAILLERTLLNLHAVPLGFNPGNLVLFDLAPSQSGYDEQRSALLYLRVLDRMRQTPGVAGVTMLYQRMLSGYASNGSVQVEGRRNGARSNFNFVGPDFFETMQIPLVVGRTLGYRDLGGPPVAVVNETFVRKYLRNGSPLGRRFRWNKDQGPDMEIVGVARDTRYDRVRGEAPPIVYAPFTRSPWGWPAKMTVAVRTAAAQNAAIAGVRQSMREIDAALPLMDLKTQRAQVDEILAEERLFAWLVSLFGSIVLALACVGLYGLVTASVASRTREIGVRMALGAGRFDVLRMMFGQVAVIAGGGLLIGLGAAWGLTRVVESRLFGVKPHDTVVFATTVVLVLLICLAAAFVPARRAMRIEPVRALRYE